MSSNIKENQKHTESDPPKNKKHYSYKKRVTRRKIWKINTFSAQKYFFMKKVLTRTSQLVHQLVQADSLDFSGSKNPKAEDLESNRAKEERTSIKIPGLYI